MQNIKNYMQDFIKELNYKPALDMFMYIKSGKMIRSKLILSITKDFDIYKYRIYEFCACIELIHLASLLHDDVIDEATTRRGTKSINEEFGAKNAIMLGDILYAKAFEKLLNFPSNITNFVSESVSKLAIGELMDIKLSNNFNYDEDIYLKMLEYKTASLIEVSAKCSAILVGMEYENLAIYGKNLGIAFQIIDDILDLTNDESILGKPSMNDFKEGKTTLVYIKLFKELNNADKDYLKSLFKKELNDFELKWIKENIKKYNIIQKTKNIAQNYINNAIKSIKHLNNQSLNDIALEMINREF